MKVGILAIQGGFELHRTILKSYGFEPVFVKSKSDLSKCIALVIPGGESTVIIKQVRICGLDESIKEFCHLGKPVMGICAGAIVLAGQVLNPTQESLNCVDVIVRRNSYGRQLSSKIVKGDFLVTNKKIDMTFIRAPAICAFGDSVVPICRYKNSITAVREGNVVISTFHPEISTDLKFYRYFCEIVGAFLRVR